MIQDVRIAMDMNREDNKLILVDDVETLRINELIRSTLCDAVRMVELECPVTMLETSYNETPSVTIQSSGKVTIPLTGINFLRLVALKMTDWSRPVSYVIAESDPEYAVLQSPWHGVCGSPQKPCVALVQKNTGLVLELSLIHI